MKKWAKRILLLVGVLLVLLIVLLLLLQTNWSKSFIKEKLQTYLSTKTNTQFVIHSIDYSLPNWVELNGVYVSDLSKDTLLYGKQIRVDVAMLKLIAGKCEINKVLLDDVYINLSNKVNDSVFNYQFIVDAFKSKSTDTTTSSTPIKFSIDDIELKNVRFNQLNYNAGVLLKLQAQHFQLKVKNVELDKMSFNVSKVLANGLKFNMQIIKEQSSATSTTAFAFPIIQLDSFHIKNSNIVFENKPQQLYSNNQISDLQLAELSNKSDINTFKVKSILLNNSNIEFNHSTQNETIVVKENAVTIQTSANTNINFVVDEISLLQNKIVYNNIAKPELQKGLDYYHLNIDNLNFVATANRYVDGVLASTIERFSFKDKGGFQLDSLSGSIQIDTSVIVAKNLVVRTPTSSINTTATVFPISGATSSSSENDIQISKTIIGKKDVQLLLGNLSEQYKEQLNILGDVLVSANIKGTTNNLNILALQVQSTKPNILNLQMSGKINNITDPKKISYNTNIQNLAVTEKLIQPFLKTVKQKIILPPIIQVNGTLVGNTNSVNANVRTNSKYGFAAIKANLQQFQQPEKMVYDIVLNAKDLETGKWIGQDSVLGKLNGNIALKGNKGFDVKNNNMKVVAAIQSFRYKENTLRNIQANSTFNNGLIKGFASIKDSLLAMNVNGSANIHGEYPTVNAVVNVAQANLYALGITNDSLTIATSSTVKIEDASPKNLKAEIIIDSIILQNASQKIVVDSSTILAFVRNDSTIIQLIAPFVDANIKSTVYYNSIPLLLNDAMAKFLPSTITTESPSKNKNVLASAAIVEATIVLKPNPIYDAFIPSLQFSEPILVNASISNANTDSAVNVLLTMPNLQLNDLRFSKSTGTLVSVDDSLKLNLLIDTVQSGNVIFYDASAIGGFHQNNLSTTITLKDVEKKEQFQASIAAKPNNVAGFDIQLGKDLLLNKEPWVVNTKNVIRTSTEGFNIQAFDISNTNQKISIHNETLAASSPILIGINDFKLSSITSLIEKSATRLEGILNATIKVSELKNAIPTIDGNLKLDSITYQNISVGNIELAAQTANNNVTVTGKILGNGNNVDMSGNYNAKIVDVKVNFNPLTLASIQPFTQGNLIRSSGTIVGPISITGAANNPVWNGTLVFDSIQTTAAQFGTIVKINNQKIAINYPTIQFNDFTISDSTNHTMRINGTLTQNNKKDFISNLSVVAKDFTAINNTAVDNNILYGKGVVDVDVNMNGVLQAPDISGSIAAKKATAIHFVRQNTSPSAKDREGVVEFVNMDTIAHLLTTATYQDVITLQESANNYGSYNYNLNIEIDPEAKFNIIIDPITRDELELQGDAQLNAALNPNGSVGLVGVYNLKKGSYQLNYQFIKRKFLLVDGSTITLSGDPLKATANITAAYEIKTSPFDLVGGEITTTTAAENDVYKRKVPFEVLLKINGEIMKPILSFDIALKEKAEGVTYAMATTIENKLQQLRTDASAMNKQVFALLVLNRFIGEQSRDFFAGNGNNSNLIANESVSGFLNGAINQIADDLIKGIDIDINLKNVDDDPNAKRTDLSVALSKSFLNDRLNISVGKSFTVDGNDPGANGKNASNNNIQFIPDVNTTYKLSKDGKFMIRAYRRNQYEALLDGYFIETGVAFTFTVNYNKLNELFKKKKNE
jgi:polyisoprenoid-binding protein YceI